MFLPPIPVAPTLNPPVHCLRCDVRWAGIDEPCWSCGRLGVITANRGIPNAHRSPPEGGGPDPYRLTL